MLAFFFKVICFFPFFSLFVRFLLSDLPLEGSMQIRKSKCAKWLCYTLSQKDEQRVATVIQNLHNTSFRITYDMCSPFSPPSKLKGAQSYFSTFSFLFHLNNILESGQHSRVDRLQICPSQMCSPRQNWWVQEVHQKECRCGGQSSEVMEAARC